MVEPGRGHRGGHQRRSGSGPVGRTVVGGGDPALQPAHLSPIIVTANAGQTWSNGLIPHGLLASPDALAVGASGETVALAGQATASQVLTSPGVLANWQLLATQPALASSPGGRACNLVSLAAVVYEMQQVVVAANCARPGVIGLLTQRPGGWQLVGPTLPASLGGDTVQVLALQSTSSGLVTLLALSGPAGTLLAAAWINTTSGNAWTVSPPLALTTNEQVSSFGPTTGEGLFVLQSGPSGEKLDVIAGPDTAWKPLPPPPTGTATVAFASPTTSTP